MSELVEGYGLVRKHDSQDRVRCHAHAFGQNPLGLAQPHYLFSMLTGEVGEWLKPPVC